MKMIKVMQLMPEGKIKDKAILEVLNNTGKIVRIDERNANALSENFYDECDDAVASKKKSKETKPCRLKIESDHSL